MLNLLAKGLKIMPVALGFFLLATNGAIAESTDAELLEKLENYSVSQLGDVRPLNLAYEYENLMSLSEYYGCLSCSYPPLSKTPPNSRWEFAAMVDKCSRIMVRLLQEENLAILSEDIEKIKRLVREFSPELKLIGSRVDWIIESQGKDESGSD